MNATLESVALIRTISRDIRSTGHCMIADRRLELIFGGALDADLKMHRLHAFARKCAWQAESLNHGRAAMFYPRKRPAQSRRHHRN